MISLVLQDFERKLFECIRDHLNKTIPLACPGIKQRVMPIIDEAIKLTNEYISLTTGGAKLRKHLGLEYPVENMQDIIDVIKQNCEVKPIRCRIVGAQILGGLEIGILRTGYADILGLSSAQYDSNGHPIEWLNWLLTKGDRLIVYGYHYVNASGFGLATSRAGGLMYKKGAWRMPAEFSGTAQNNFLTRAFDDISVQNAIAKEIEAEIGLHI